MGLNYFRSNIPIFSWPNVFTRYFSKVLIYFDNFKIEEISRGNVGTNATSEIISKECYFRSLLTPLWKKSSIKGSYSSTDSLDSYVIQALVLQISYTPLKKVSWVFMYIFFLQKILKLKRISNMNFFSFIWFFQ